MIRRLFLCIGIVATLTSCATIDKFTVSTFVACAGEAVTADWATHGGNVTLATTPSLTGAGPQAGQGARDFAVEQDTTLLLEVHGLLNTDRGENKVVVRPLSQWIGGAAVCTAAPAVVEYAGAGRAAENLDDLVLCRRAGLDLRDPLLVGQLAALVDADRAAAERDGRGRRQRNDVESLAQGNHLHARV